MRLTTTLAARILNLLSNDIPPNNPQRSSCPNFPKGKLEATSFCDIFSLGSGVYFNALQRAVSLGCSGGDNYNNSDRYLLRLP